MKYYVYGGAFNPPTIAHQKIAEELVRCARPQNAGVIILPSGNRSDKQIDTPLNIRLDYLKAMIADIGDRGVIVSIETMELYRGYEIQTSETAVEMSAKYPNDELVWVFGSDSFNTIPEWEGGAQLLEDLSMMIIERPGYPVNPALYSTQEKITLSSVSGTSSTEVRNRMVRGDDFRELVGANVHRVIHSL